MVTGHRDLVTVYMPYRFWLLLGPIFFFGRSIYFGLLDFGCGKNNPRMVFRSLSNVLSPRAVQNSLASWILGV